MHAAAAAPPGPWMYTGGMENHPALVARIARDRPLWGNGPDALGVARSPRRLAELLDGAGCPRPAIGFCPADASPGRRWLVKPLAGSGGAGICFWPCSRPALPRRAHLQQYIEGVPYSAAFCADSAGVHLLGATRQLVGEPWLHATPFQYCGSIGPIDLAADLADRIQALGQAIARGAGLRGLFGIDFVLRDGVPWPVEVNPRYTASMEVLEHALGVSALGLHRRAFEPDAPELSDPSVGERPRWLGKAIRFARHSFAFPAEGPWSASVAAAPPAWRAPDFADVPRGGARIAVGEPVLTLFAAGTSEADCVARLRRSAGELDWRLGDR